MHNAEQPKSTPPSHTPERAASAAKEYIREKTDRSERHSVLRVTDAELPGAPPARRVLGIPLAKRELGDSGTYDLELGDLRVSAAYRPLTSEEVERVAVRSAKDATPQEAASLNYEFRHWRKLEHMIVRDDGSESPLSLADALPEDWMVVFRSGEQDAASPPVRADAGSLLMSGLHRWVMRRTKGGAAPDAKIIRLPRTPVSLGDLLTLLHEIGHARIAAATDEESRLAKEARIKRAKEDPNPSYEDLEALLREERNAWAVALEAVRPLLAREKPVLSKEELFSFVHGVMLGSYGELLAKKIALRALGETVLKK